jgi:8-oxo-dGTP diphosphatase
MNKERNTNFLGSNLVLMQDDKILLQRRYNTGYKDGEYGLPSGHVERGETFTQAIIREVKEEIGIILKIDDVKVVHIMHRKSEDTSEWVSAFCLAHKWENKVQNMEPNKCDDLSWFSINNLPNNTIDYIKLVLKQIKDKKFYSEYNW